jgi:hypothetical protein
MTLFEHLREVFHLGIYLSLSTIAGLAGALQQRNIQGPSLEKGFLLSKPSPVDE